MAPRSTTVTDLDAWETAYLRFQTQEQEVRKFVRRLRRLGADAWPKDASILELFCGRGNDLTALERLGFTRLRGVDLSPRLVGLYRGCGRCVVGDCRALPFGAASQDVVVAQGGLHHLPTLPDDLEQVIDEVRRVLKPEGRFVVVEPWRTPFLDVMHRVGCHPTARRAWEKVDAFATMIELEGDTYLRWLREPQLISGLLCRSFEPSIKVERWGKLLFVGRPLRRSG
jgi:SAM-dependent methyltransferase